MFAEKLINKARRAIDQYCFEYSLYRSLPIVYERSPRWTRPDPIEYSERLRSVYECYSDVARSENRDLLRAEHYMTKAGRLIDMFDPDGVDDVTRFAFELDPDSIHGLLDLMAKQNVEAGVVVSHAARAFKLVESLRAQGIDIFTVSPMGNTTSFPTFE